MSKKSSAASAFRDAAKAAAGSHLTVQARMQTADRLVDLLYMLGYQIRKVDSLGARHLAAYITQRQAEGVGIRTLQNEASHIRGILSAAGRGDLARNAQIGNKALGINGSSRFGTNTAATTDQYEAAVSLMAQRDPGLAVLLKLERTLGLRSQEAIRAGASLNTWEKQLSSGGRAHVIYGTKGGRDRYAAPANRAEALKAVRDAQVIAQARNGRLLQGSLKSASTRYRNEMHRYCEITGHQLRYAYTQELLDGYLSAGYSMKEAKAMASINLGHGDGRGQYVQQVYGRR